MTWSDDDALWEMTEPAMFTSERIANAPQEVDHLIELLRIKPPARVLDMCTGPGRHAIELAKRGFAVTGVDRTARYLERARIDAAEARVEVELMPSHIRRRANSARPAVCFSARPLDRSSVEAGFGFGGVIPVHVGSAQ